MNVLLIGAAAAAAYWLAKPKPTAAAEAPTSGKSTDDYQAGTGDMGSSGSTGDTGSTGSTGQTEQPPSPACPTGYTRDMYGECTVAAAPPPPPPPPAEKPLCRRGLVRDANGNCVVDLSTTDPVRHGYGPPPKHRAWEQNRANSALPTKGRAGYVGDKGVNASAVVDRSPAAKLDTSAKRGTGDERGTPPRASGPLEHKRGVGGLRIREE